MKACSVSKGGIETATEGCKGIYIHHMLLKTQANNRNIQITLSPFSPGSPGFPGTPWNKHRQMG